MVHGIVRIQETHIRRFWSTRLRHVQSDYHVLILTLDIAIALEIITQIHIHLAQDTMVFTNSAEILDLLVIFSSVQLTWFF